MSETYTNLLQWLVILAFFLLVVGAMFAEAFWISKKGWASFGKGFVFSALSNFIGFAVGLFIFFIIMAAFLMFSLDGTTDRIFSSKIGGPAAIAVLIFAFLITPLLLIICKRIFLGVLKIQTGKSAWFYAMLSSVLIVVVSLGVPILLGYFIFR
jgi:hypothetical protein